MIDLDYLLQSFLTLLNPLQVGTDEVIHFIQLGYILHVLAGVLLNELSLPIRGDNGRALLRREDY